MELGVGRHVHHQQEDRIFFSVHFCDCPSLDLSKRFIDSVRRKDSQFSVAWVAPSVDDVCTKILSVLNYTFYYTISNCAGKQKCRLFFSKLRMIGSLSQRSAVPSTTVANASSVGALRKFPNHRRRSGTCAVRTQTAFVFVGVFAFFPKRLCAFCCASGQKENTPPLQYVRIRINATT